MGAPRLRVRRYARPPDRTFIGRVHTGILTTTALAGLVRSLPPGVTELMVHPGYADDDLEQTGTRLLECGSWSSICSASSRRARSLVGERVDLLRHDLTHVMKGAFVMSRNAVGAPQLSIVVPLFNEVATIYELHKRLTGVLLLIGVPVGDRLRGRRQQRRHGRGADGDLRARPSRAAYHRSRRNYGQTAALAAGFDAAAGDVIVAMDGDLQHAPEEIPKLLAKSAKDTTSSAAGGNNASTICGRAACRRRRRIG